MAPDRCYLAQGPWGLMVAKSDRFYIWLHLACHNLAYTGFGASLAHSRRKENNFMAQGLHQMAILHTSDIDQHSYIQYQVVENGKWCLWPVFYSSGAQVMHRMHVYMITVYICMHICKNALSRDSTCKRKRSNADLFPYAHVMCSVYKGLLRGSMLNPQSTRIAFNDSKDWWAYIYVHLRRDATDV